MKRTSTMIDIFNNLNDNCTDESGTLDNVIGLHYHKFRYFYNAIKNITVGVISMTPFYSDDSMNVAVTFDTTENRSLYIDSLIASIEEMDCFEKNHFNYSSVEEGDLALNISVVNHKITREDELYGD